ncbi:hypothetical protein [Aliamphritea spongicola]|nr:hypothetical protein [Aliamphritea spongicola]
MNDADWLQEDNREEAFRQRLNSLTSFSRELLDIAAIGGVSNDLSKLARVTGNPIARLAIHLWPAEQAGVLVREEHTPEQISYHFADPELQTILCGQLSHDEQQHLHRQFALTLYKDLQADSSQPGPVLRHLNRLDTPPPELHRQTLNLQAAEHARQNKDYAQAARYLQYAVTDASDTSQQTDLLLQSAELHLLSSDIRQADNCLQAIRQQPDTSELPPHYQTRHALLQARLYQAQNRSENALEVLCRQLATDHQPLPSGHGEQLSLLLSQLERISQISSHNSRHNELPDDNLQLELLEHISLLARQLSQPLLAACAIGQMTEHCLLHPGSALAAFAFSSYAWVASWFCADTQLARSFTSKAMHLADSTNHPAQTGSAALRLNSQVQHWFTPLQEVRQQLAHTLELAGNHHQWPTLSEGQLLAAHLDLFSNTPLNELYPQLQQQHQQMLNRQQHTQAAWLEESVLTAIHQLQGKEPPPASLNYQHGWQAVSCCISALLLDQQHLWPDLYRWEARLENELAGYFGVSEALFCTTLMRLIQAGQQQAISRRRQLETEQLISRLELWATQSPDNFNCQLQLLKAEQSRFQPDSQITALYFEQALQAAERQQFSFHRALVNERYADFLQHNGQTTLARYCLQEAMDFYRHWQADAKIKQLAQTLELLAK